MVSTTSRGRGRLTRRAGLVGAAALAAVFATTGARAEMPRSLNLATHGIGSLYNALGSGIATVLTRNANTVVRVQPFAGPPAWLPSMDEGKTDLGILTGADAVTSYNGISLYKKPFKNTRLIAVGGSLHLSFYVKKDSPMETVSDLKGKKVPSGFSATPIVGLSTKAALASAGLTFEDVDAVPVSNLGVGNQAFIEGRLDAGWHSVGSPAVKEADARVGGVKFISVNDTPEGAKRMEEVYPGSYPSTLKAGAKTGVVKDTSVLTNDIYLVGSKKLSDEAAYTIVKTLWEKNDQLAAAHPELAAWTRERMVNEKAFIPYHEGAVKFFKEKGVWTEKMQALQAKLTK